MVPNAVVRYFIHGCVCSYRVAERSIPTRCYRLDPNHRRAKVSTKLFHALEIADLKTVLHFTGKLLEFSALISFTLLDMLNLTPHCLKKIIPKL